MNRALAVLALFTSLPIHAAVDLDTDGFGDVWRLKYPGPALAPEGDADADGQSNAAEEVIGTNPYDPLDTIRITSITRASGQDTLKWPSIDGKRYQVEWAANPAAVNWTPAGAVLAGTGAEITANHSSNQSGRFYRVRVFDTDSDGDGVTDWEEIQVGYDPEDDHHGDLAALTTALQSPSVVTVTASDSEATEPSNTVSADPASFKIRRTGGIAPLSVPLSMGGTTSPSDIAALPSSVSLPLAATETTVNVTPLADVITESDEAVILTAATDPAYVLGDTKTASVLIHDNVQANGTGLLANYWKHPNSTDNAPYSTGAPTIARIDAQVKFDSASAAWPGAPITSGTTSNYFTSRWMGEVLPEFTQVYTFYSHTNDGGRLWVDGQLLIDNWPPATVSTSEKSAIIQLTAGRRTPIVFEHYNNSGTHRAILSWQSSSRPKEFIPQSRLFPNTPPIILGPFEAWAFVGSPTFIYQINASASPTSYSAAPLPPGFSINSASGLISGNPVAPGVFDIAISATNANGSGSAILRLNILQTGGGITREIWTGNAGSMVSDIPLSTTPNSTSVLTSFTTPSNSGDDYGVRIRGFLTAPATGEYRFFLRADEAAEFRLSDDEEPVNAWKRCELTGPVTDADWSSAASSPLLHLDAGERYYIEVLHKESSGADHLALGWAKPGQPDNTPSEVVPGYLLTRFEDVQLGGTADGTLYFAQLGPQSGAVTNGYGTCTLRLSPDQTTAWVTPEFSNLGSTFTGMHIHDSRLPNGSNIIFDPDEVGVEHLADGSYVWHIADTAGLTTAQIVAGLGQYAYFNVHTAIYPGGEIKGFFRLLDGSSNFTPPPAPPEWTVEASAANTDANAASRFLQQATFGPHPSDITALQALPSYDAWIEDQFTKAPTYHLPFVEQFRNLSNANSPTYGGSLTFNSWWKNSIEAEDQLRQRIAFALHEIMVVSESGPLDDRANALSDYYDMLLNHAFGNVRELLEAVTLHPAMGRYLDMLRNDKPNLSTGLIPNENYAREILQLFSLGLNRMHPDGSLILNSKGLPIPVYDQNAIIGFAHGFTGWDYGYTGSYRTSLNAPTNWIDPMREVPARHFIGKKRLLNNVVLPGLSTVAGAPIDPYASHTTAQTSDPAYQALAAQELEIMHDQIFQHPNFGPFLCRQLIQRLVTSTPSRGYIYRVASKFNDNGSGVRGDMKAIIKAILLDYEARSNTASNSPGYGKQREPVTRVTQLVRAFRPANNFAGTFAQDGGLITVDTNPMNHRLSSNLVQKVMLGFTSAGVPATDGDYSVLSVSGNTFTVRTRDIQRADWTQSGGSIEVITPANHGFVVGESVYIRFRNGHPPDDGVFVVASISGTDPKKFTVAAPSFTGSGQCDVAWLSGVYSQTTPSGGSATLTITCNTVPGLAAGAKLEMSFTPVTGQTLIPPDGTYTIVDVSGTDVRRYTVTPDAGTLPVTTSTLSGNFHAASPSMVVDRSGTAISGYSDWNVGDTETDLGQTPLRSPTVFNYFLPDYQHPGILANNGLVTPEFELSSETNVIRQSNYLYGGVYSTSNTTTVPTTGGYTSGFSSFKTGNHDMMMDFSSWMVARPGGTGYWTDTANLRDLIREFSKILMAGRMSSALEDQIYNFVSSTSNIAYTSAAPLDYERRNRVRAIVYLISISPELAIQR